MRNYLKINELLHCQFKNNRYLCNTKNNIKE